MSGAVAFGAAISERCACHGKGRQHAAIVAAGRGAGNRILVDLAPYYGHPHGVVARFGELAARHDPVDVVIDPRSQAATLIRPLAEAGIVVTEPGTSDVAVAHGEFLDLVNDGGLAHLDQEPLTAAVRAAGQRPLAGAQAWERRLPVDQSPLEAATLATWGFLRWDEQGNYDARRSVHFDTAELIRLCKSGVYGPGDVERVWSRGLLDDAALALLAAEGIPLPAAALRGG